MKWVLVHAIKDGRDAAGKPNGHLIQSRHCGGTRKSSLLLTLGIAVAMLGGGTGSAAAQDDIPTGEFSVLRFSPAPGGGNFLGVDGANVDGHLRPSVGLTLDYAYRPLVVVGCRDEDNCQFDKPEFDLVEHVGVGHLHGAVTVIDRIQVSLVAPLVLMNGDPMAFTRGDARVDIHGGTDARMGDPRLRVKGQVYDQGEEGFDVGAVVYATAPVAQNIGEDTYAGDSGPRVGGHVVGEYTYGPLRVAANVGGFWRSEETLFDTQIGSEVTYGAASSYTFRGIDPPVSVLAELEGATGLSRDIEENALEARVGGRLRYDDFVFKLGVGAGVIQGTGSPPVRVIGQAAWRPSGRKDKEESKKCPGQTEDHDGFQDDDGCPDPDNDQDGVPDEQDECPMQAEDRDGFQDDDGCPDEDNDGDGIADGYDSCPNKPEDKDGDRDNDGCPDKDTDRDGIPDAEDDCPKAAEDMDGFGDKDGCPEKDFDQDGLAEIDDACPAEPEVFNGVKDDDGCPEEDADDDGIPDTADDCPDRAETFNGHEDADGCPDGKALAKRTDEGIELVKSVEFRGQGTGWLPPRAKRTITAAGTLLSLYRHLGTVRVVVYVDGDAELARKRAEMVRERLVKAGVAQDRVSAEGKGSREDDTSRDVAIQLEPWEIEPPDPAQKN